MKTFVGVLFFLMFSVTGNAGLIEVDFANQGDGFLTYDSESGLEWLDIGRTGGKSVRQVRDGYGGYINSSEDSFRYATQDEVDTLLNHFGIMSFSSSRYNPTGNSTYMDAMENMFGLMGISNIMGPYSGIIEKHMTAWFDVGEFLTGKAGKLDVACTTHYTIPDICRLGFVNNPSQIHHIDGHHGGVGHLLVREAIPVSEPPSLYLMMLLSAIVLIVKRRQYKHV